MNKRSPKTVLKKETIDKRDEGNEKYFNKCKVIFSQEKYVSEAIKEDYYMKWTPTTPVFISAQTGAGKNTFIEKVLIEKMVPRKTKVLILSNRIALGRQEKGRLAEIMDRIEPRPSGERTYKQDVARRNGEMLDDLEDFGSVMIKSYQGLNASKEIFKKEYDYILLDTPPVLPVTDASALSTKADGVLLVVASNSISPSEARLAKTRLELAGAKIIGCVLNKVDVAPHGYGYGYGKTKRKSDA